MKKIFSYLGIATLTLFVLSGCCSTQKKSCCPASQSSCCSTPKKAAN